MLEHPRVKPQSVGWRLNSGVGWGGGANFVGFSFGPSFRVFFCDPEGLKRPSASVVKNHKKIRHACVKKERKKKKSVIFRLPQWTRFWLLQTVFGSAMLN